MLFILQNWVFIRDVRSFNLKNLVAKNEIFHDPEIVIESFL